MVFDGQTQTLPTTLFFSDVQPCLCLSPSPPPGRYVISSSDHLLLTYGLLFQDLGKSANDLLGKDYPFHGASLEVKTKTPSDVAFRVTGNRDSKTDAISGDIEGKWTDRKHGLTFTQAWTTSNILRNTVEIDNQIAKGVKVELNTTLSPDKGAKTAVFNTFFKQSGLNTRASLDVFRVSTNLVPI